MPKKVRVLKKLLRKAGFQERPGRGSHQVWQHPELADSVTISYKDGDDAPLYLERQVMAALKQLEKIDDAGE